MGCWVGDSSRRPMSCGWERRYVGRAHRQMSSPPSVRPAPDYHPYGQPHGDPFAFAPLAPLTRPRVYFLPSRDRSEGPAFLGGEGRWCSFVESTSFHLHLRCFELLSALLFKRMLSNCNIPDRRTQTPIERYVAEVMILSGQSSLHGLRSQQWREISLQASYFTRASNSTVTRQTAAVGAALFSPTRGPTLN